jgi:hypothetical protein
VHKSLIFKQIWPLSPLRAMLPSDKCMVIVEAGDAAARAPPIRSVVAAKVMWRQRSRSTQMFSCQRPSCLKTAHSESTLDKRDNRQFPQNGCVSKLRRLPPFCCHAKVQGYNPFLLSILLLGVGWFVRARVPETPIFEKVKRRGAISRNPFVEAILKNPRVRYSGASFGFQLSAALGAGFSPIIATALAGYMGGTAGVSMMLILLASITFIATLFARETKNRSLLD